MVITLVSFPIVTKGAEGGKAWYGSQLEVASITTGEWQELEAAGHSTSTAEQKSCMRSSLTSAHILFTQSGTPAQATVPPAVSQVT